MRNLVSLVLILFVGACSPYRAAQNIIPGSGLPQLTGSQKQRMGDFAQANVDSQGATSAHNKRPESEVVQQFIRMARKASSSRELSQKGVEVASQVSEAIESDECLLTAEWPEPETPNQKGASPELPFQVPVMRSVSNQGDSFNLEINVEIGNNKSTQCPIVSLFNISMNGKITQTDQQSAHGRFEIGFINNFEVKEWAPLYTEMDVVGFNSDFKMGIELNANQAGFSLSGTGTGEMSIVSKPSFEGVVGLKTAMNLSATGSDENNVHMNMQIVSDFQFTDFQAVGVIRGSMQGQQENMTLTYFINGNSVTEQEYMDFFSGSFTTDSLQAIDASGEGAGMNLPISVF